MRAQEKAVLVQNDVDQQWYLPEMVLMMIDTNGQHQGMLLNGLERTVDDVDLGAFNIQFDKVDLQPLPRQLASDRM